MTKKEFKRMLFLIHIYMNPTPDVGYNDEWILDENVMSEIDEENVYMLAELVKKIRAELSEQERAERAEFQRLKAEYGYEA